MQFLVCFWSVQRWFWGGTKTGIRLIPIYSAVCIGLISLWWIETKYKNAGLGSMSMYGVESSLQRSFIIYCLLSVEIGEGADYHVNLWHLGLLVVFTVLLSKFITRSFTVRLYSRSLLVLQVSRKLSLSQLFASSHAFPVQISTAAGTRRHRRGD